MTVTLIQPYGAFAAGSSVTLTNDTETALVAQGLATAGAADTTGITSLLLVRTAAGVVGVLDQATGTVIPFAELVAGITSGTINGATIGLSVPAAATFSSVGFHSVAPVAQAAFVATLSVVPVSVSGLFGFSTSAAFSGALTALNSIQQVLVNHGLMAAA